MKRFAFRLEKVLELRKYKESEVEMRLAGATSLCVRLEQEILDLQVKKNETLQVLTQSLEPGWILSCEAYTRRLVATAEKRQVELASAQIQREKIQAEFILAQRDRKILDKLKEKKHAAYKKEQIQNEFKIQDDRNTGAYIKKQEA
ncbi:MAG: flagellar export protein FliJ [Spirochaetes bacterium GWB1_48_6]|nr:MAG: flagellar export protein FliJ [Spirochaetes bacterium GWB1_48_6]